MSDEPHREGGREVEQSVAKRGGERERESEGLRLKRKKRHALSKKKTKQKKTNSKLTAAPSPCASCA